MVPRDAAQRAAVAAQRAAVAAMSPQRLAPTSPGGGRHRPHLGRPLTVARAPRSIAGRPLLKGDLRRSSETRGSLPSSLQGCGPRTSGFAQAVHSLLGVRTQAYREERRRALHRRFAHPRRAAECPRFHPIRRRRQ